MPRSLLVAVATAATAALAAPAAHAERCSQVHRPDLAPAPQVRLVERPDGAGGTDLVGCVLPRGAVRIVANRSGSDQDLDEEDYTLWQVANEKVLVDVTSGDQYGGYASMFVEDLRTERTYLIFSTCTEIISGFCPGPPGPAPLVLAARINAKGQAAVVFNGSPDRTVTSYTTQGARTDLDTGDIAPKSLRLGGSTVRWTNAGAPRSATIDG